MHTKFKTIVTSDSVGAGDRRKMCTDNRISAHKDN